MKSYAKMLGVVSVALAIQLTLAAVEKGLGDDLISRGFTVISNSDNIFVSRAFTVISNSDNIFVSRAFTVTSNADNIFVSRAITAVKCEEDPGGLCGDCDGDDIPDQCELDCGEKGGLCDVPGCGMSDDCNSNGIPDDCDIDPEDPAGNGQVSLNCNGNGIPDECEPDCDDDGIPDDCEISDCSGEPECSDCNGNGIPDECDADCDQDGIPDQCEIADCAGEPHCSDCNGNGIPDECDIDPLDPDGDGQVSGDCDGDGVPDECEIASCPPDTPACADCNLNGIPDACDVDPLDPDGNGQVSLDLDDDGAPDECIEWDAGGGDELWGTKFNWEDDIVPGVKNPDILESVLIEGAGTRVFLDVTADIDSLVLGPEAALVVDAGDLTVRDPTGIFPGNMLVQGELLAANDRTIDTAGAVTVGAGGTYEADPDAIGEVSATLTAGSVTLLGCPGLEEGCGGSMTLTGTMELGSSGDLNLNGCALDDKGSGTPPDFKVRNSSSTTIGGSVNICGGGSVDYSSSQPMVLGGDFDNQSTEPLIFDWSSGGLMMDGVSQSIEAAGEDRGPWPIGLLDNFAFGTLTLAPGTVVEVVNTFDNQQDGVVACDEALYVDLLEVGAGAVLITNGCPVYYNTLDPNDGSILGLGTDVRQILTPGVADLDGNGEVRVPDLIILLSGWGACPEPCTQGEPADTCAADLDGNCEIRVPDLIILLAAWG